MALSGTITEPGVLDTRALERAGVQVTDASSINAYIARHSDMAALVSDVCNRVMREFGDVSQISLVVYEDAETPDSFLAVFVRQAEYNPDIMRRTNAIMHEYSDRLSGASGWIQVTTDFQPPR